MRDDRNRWDPATFEFDTIQAKNVEISQVRLSRQTMISRPGIATDARGWGDQITGETYIVALRRDRILEVGGPETEEGWIDGAAISDISDGFIIFDITGANALALMQCGTELSETPSKSVSRQLWGHTVLLYKHDAALRLHVLRAEAQALYANLSAALAGMP